MPYTHTSLAQARTALSQKLDDPTNVFWSAPELNEYIFEALRTWQAYTGFFRAQVPLQTLPGVAFYDLAQIVPEFGIYLTQADLYRVINYHLLEPAAVPIAGTGQFGDIMISTALEKRRNQFKVDTGCMLSQSYLGSAGNRTQLPDTVIDVRRASWLTSFYKTLWRIDEFGSNAYDYSWPNPDPSPENYSIISSPPITVQLVPPSATPGNLELVTVDSGPAFDYTATTGIPDDFSWGVKWGALADLMGQDGECRDPLRSVYAESRYRESVEIAKLSGSLINCKLGMVPIFSGTLFDLDHFDADWENRQEQPYYAAMAGRNLLALGGVPDAHYSFTLDLIANIPTPLTDSDFLQVGREHMDAILNYAHHVACYKMGGQEFVNTFPFQKALVALASLQNSRLKAMAFYKELMEGTGWRMERAEARVAAGTQKIQEVGNASVSV